MSLFPNIKRDYAPKTKMLMFCLLRTGIKYKDRELLCPGLSSFSLHHALPTAPINLPVFYVAVSEWLSLSKLKIKYCVTLPGRLKA